MTSYIIEKERKTDIALECDVLVAGGGIGGVAAAIAAARNGAKVILLEREFLLGGLATLGLITIYLPICDGMGHQISFGLAEELLHLSIKHGAEKHYPKAWLEDGTQEERINKRFMTQFNPHIFAIEMEQMLLDLGVHVLYGSVAVDVKKEGDRIDSVIIENKSGRSAIRSKTVIDSTGDSDICKYAEAETAVFKNKNGLASWYYYYEQSEVHLKMFGLADLVEGHNTQGTGNETVEVISNKRYTGLDGLELSEMVINARHEMFKDIMEKKAKNPEYVPVTISNLPLVRMTRRLCGKYTMDDSEMHTYFEDSIGTICDWRKRGPVYELPFRCLIGDDIKNLYVAGRNISVTDAMWDITRVIPVCAVTGEAAGTAAALYGDVDKVDIKGLQEQLLAQNVVLHHKFE
ncbi:FAD-dependent oxidoreductase [Alkalibacter rhizosphaerae]|uniref:FAD-dependent oxidoreductase n=1 Tax=Alkalibacter rhizosphaerae TaxID=2815577 RepID=A0A975AJ58_9FIRM|nr:FAD-dependent oxidoreductase [Alkalibacter rhizosphaerae]QSX09235.1 FAD-dependent oxidoreductase [Alkalibacter rhizosphaerae]